MRFILASASPARLATLRRAGVHPDVIVSGVDESAISAASPRALAGVLASAKMTAVHERVEGPALVLGCDSVLEFEGEALGKPGHPDIAAKRWREMRGRSGILHTGHALRGPQGAAEVTVSTVVHFADLSDAEIDLYCGTGEPSEVAGGFTIDGLGGWFVSGVEGDPHNVVGISLPTVRLMLAELGYELSDLGYPSR